MFLPHLTNAGILVCWPSSDKFLWKIDFMIFLFHILKNRKQCVVVDNCKSNMKDIEAGVPKGSRLGPLLWILYVQDIIEKS